ncbi:MAG: TonB-dependent receptor [Flavobacteriales bacterium]|nr:TonB-dependent receptor [Flavobacteriales bacterium]
MKFKSYLFMLGMLFFSFTSYSQKSVSGKVTDKSTGDPIPGVTVVVDGTTTGVFTNNDGVYTIKASQGQTIVFSYIGYETMKVTVGDASSYDVILKSGIALDEIVISGQGAGISKRRLSTTVDVINSEEIERLPANQIDQLLQSNAPSAQIRLSSGQPGTAAIIRTRGPISASSSSTPVIIVDGIRVDNLNSNPELGVATGGADVSALADIPVESIEKIEYIKGGAATTLYGADAANGVIQIITKKGKAGKVTPFIETRMGSITAEDKWLAYDRTGEAMFEPGFLSEFKAGLSGGTNAFSYNFVGSIYQDDGFNDLNEQLKRSFNFGFTSKLGDRWTYTGALAYTNFDYNLDYNANTSWSRFSAAEGGAFGNLDELSDADWEDVKEQMVNQGALTNISQTINRISGSNKLSYNIADGWNTNVTFGVENRKSRQQEIISNAFQIEIGSIPEGTTDQAALNKVLRDVYTTTADWNLVNVADKNDLSFITTVGARFFRTNDYQESLSGVGGVDGTSSVGNFAEKSSDDFALENANYGFYLLENVGYRNKLFFELGGSLDRNTSAGDDVGYLFLPKIGATYNTGEINNVLSNVRVRANYGEATNFAQPFSQDRTFALESFLGGPAFRFDNPGNNDLKSERVQTSEVGAELTLMDYRVDLGITYYNAKTVDALFTPDNVPSSGQLAQITNIGEITNKGWEFSLGAKVLELAKHELSVFGSFNINDNEVSDMGGAPPFSVGGFTVVGSWIDEGMSLGFLRGTEAVLQDDGTYQFNQNALLGNSFAPRFGSISLNYSFDKKLNVFATSDYQYGGTNVDLSFLLRHLRGVDNTGIPEDLIGTTSPFNYVNFVAKSSNFFKVRNIGAAYDLSSIIDGKLGGLSNIRVGLSMTNPFSWTASNFDPEVTGSGIGDQNGFGSGGFAYGTESAPRQVIGSVKLTF